MINRYCLFLTAILFFSVNTSFADMSIPPKPARMEMVDAEDESVVSAEVKSGSSVVKMNAMSNIVIGTFDFYSGNDNCSLPVVPNQTNISIHVSENGVGFSETPKQNKMFSVFSGVEDFLMDAMQKTGRFMITDISYSGLQDDVEALVSDLVSKGIVSVVSGSIYANTDDKFWQDEQYCVILRAYDLETRTVLATNRTVGDTLSFVLDDACADLAKKMPIKPFHASIVEVEGDAGFINAGKRSGMYPGFVFNIVSKGRAIKDLNGKIIGRTDSVVGKVKIKEVLGDELSSFTVIDRKGSIKVGDIIRADIFDGKRPETEKEKWNRIYQGRNIFKTDYKPRGFGPEFAYVPPAVVPEVAPSEPEPEEPEPVVEEEPEEGPCPLDEENQKYVMMKNGETRAGMMQRYESVKQEIQASGVDYSFVTGNGYNRYGSLSIELDEEGNPYVTFMTNGSTDESLVIYGGQIKGSLKITRMELMDMSGHTFGGYYTRDGWTLQGTANKKTKEVDMKEMSTVEDCYIDASMPISVQMLPAEFNTKDYKFDLEIVEYFVIPCNQFEGDESGKLKELMQAATSLSPAGERKKGLSESGKAFNEKAKDKKEDLKDDGYSFKY